MCIAVKKIVLWFWGVFRVPSRVLIVGSDILFFKKCILIISFSMCEHVFVIFRCKICRRNPLLKGNLVFRRLFSNWFHDLYLFVCKKIRIKCYKSIEKRENRNQCSDTKINNTVSLHAKIKENYLHSTFKATLYFSGSPIFRVRWYWLSYLFRNKVKDTRNYKKIQ